MFSIAKQSVHSACSLAAPCRILLQCGAYTTSSDQSCCLVFPECWSWLQGYKPDYMYLLQRTMMDSPDAAVNLAKMIAKQPGPPIELNVIADLFLQRNMVREATAFLLDVLQDNSPEQEKLQTKVSVAIPQHSSRVGRLLEGC